MNCRSKQYRISVALSLTRNSTIREVCKHLTLLVCKTFPGSYFHQLGCGRTIKLPIRRISRWRMKRRPIRIASIRNMNLKSRSQQKPRKNPKHTNWVEFRNELALQIKDVSSNIEDKGHLDMAAERFDEAVRCSFQNNYDLRTQKRTKKVSWWNNTLADLRDSVTKAWNRVKNTCNKRSRRKASEGRKRL